MTDFIYSMAIAQLLDVKTDVDKVLQDFRENQHLLLKKYGYIPTHKYYIDFNGGNSFFSLTYVTTSF